MEFTKKEIESLYDAFKYVSDTKETKSKKFESRKESEMQGFIVINEETKRIEVWDGNDVSTDCIEINADTYMLVSSLMHVGYNVLVKKSEKDVEKLLKDNMAKY